MGTAWGWGYGEEKKRWSNQQTFSHFIFLFCVLACFLFLLPCVTSINIYKLKTIKHDNKQVWHWHETSISSSKASETHVFVVILAPLYGESHNLYECGFLQTYSVTWWLISIKIIICVEIICHLLLSPHFKNQALQWAVQSVCGWRTRKADEEGVHIWTLL